VGRNAELADLTGLLATKRLVTVTGPPGAGKTRLALAVAHAAAPNYPHGVCFVPLAEIDEPGLVPSGIAAALGVSSAEESVRDALIDHLRTQRLLLLLDNVEHLLPEVSVVGELLDAAPGLRVLATSRAPLRLSGEQEYPLAPLPLPVPEDLAATEDPGAFDALALFADRAKDIDHHFALTEDNARTVAGVVARVDGLPLGIELAAARLRLFPLPELHRRVTDVLPQLVEGAVDQPTRHRTLRDAIGWSFRLLDPREQLLLRRLGVFRGGFTLDAAKYVAAGEVADTAAGISKLIEASLVQPPVATDHVRYAMLETVREYAVEQLRVGGEYESVARRHTDFYADLVQRAEPELTRAEQPRWLRHLEAEHDNLCAVLRWSLREGDLDHGLVTAGRLWRYWHFRGRLTEGRTWLAELLTAAKEVPSVARTKTLLGMAGICYWQGDLDTAEAHYRLAVDAAQALEPAATDDDRYVTPWWLELEALLGLVATIACHRGEPEAVAPLEEQYLALVAEHSADPLAMGTSTAATALVRLFTGDLDGCRHFGDLVVSATRAIGERWYESQMIRTLALVSVRQQRFEQAEDELRTSLGISADLGDLPNVAMDMERLGQTAVGLGRPSRAVTLAAAAARLREELGGCLTIDDLRWETVPPAEAAREMLAETEFDLAWAGGRSLGIDKAIAYACSSDAG
jgi:predicted ATPase